MEDVGGGRPLEARGMRFTRTDLTGLRPLHVHTSRVKYKLAKWYVASQLNSVEFDVSMLLN